MSAENTQKGKIYCMHLRVYMGNQYKRSLKVDSNILVDLFPIVEEGTPGMQNLWGGASKGTPVG